MPGKAYMADTVKRDMERLGDLLEMIKIKGIEVLDQSDFEEAEKIVRSYFNE